MLAKAMIVAPHPGNYIRTCRRGPDRSGILDCGERERLPGSDYLRAEQPITRNVRVRVRVALLRGLTTLRCECELFQASARKRFVCRPHKFDKEPTGPAVRPCAAILQISPQRPKVLKSFPAAPDLTQRYPETISQSARSFRVGEEFGWFADFHGRAC